MKKNCNLVEIPKKTEKETSVKQLYKSKKIEKKLYFSFDKNNRQKQLFCHQK